MLMATSKTAKTWKGDSILYPINQNIWLPILCCQQTTCRLTGISLRPDIIL